MPSSTQPPQVSILLLTFNGTKYMPALFESLEKQTLQSFEVVVVDNSPEHNTTPAVEAAWPEATIIKAPSNLGMTGGCNLAVQHARGKYIVLLNQDAIAHPEFLEKLVSCAEADPTVGAAHSKILLQRDPTLVDTVGNRANYLFLPAGRSATPPKDTTFGEPRDVQYVSGAAVLFPRQRWREIGGFDDSLWMYHDDLDISLRLKLRGYRVVCVPDSMVYHDYDEEPSMLKLEWLERNRLLLLRKYYRRRTLVKLLPIIAASEAGILLMAAKGGWLKIKLRSYKQFFRPDKRALKDGAALRRQTGYTDRQLLEYMGCGLSTGPVGGAFVQRLATKMIRGYYKVALRLV